MSGLLVLHRVWRASFFALACGGLFAAPTSADDSTAQLGAGGLLFTKADSIRMASEDLYLSPKAVRIRYGFVNDGPNDVKTIVAFPLPDIDSYEFYGEGIGTVQSDPVNFVGFRAIVDGKPVPVQVEQRAFYKGRDVTAQVKAAGLPVNVLLAGNSDLIARLPKDRIAALIKADLIEDEGAEGDHSYAAKWLVRTKFWWTQDFPAGKTVIIEHSYKPVTGQAFFTETDLNATPGTQDDYWKKTYCMDQGTLAQLARQLAAQKKSNTMDGMMSASSTDFILRTANNWKGGIGHFHLTIDKLSPGNTLSLCHFDDIRKTGPTTFEVTRENFAPADDIRVVVLSTRPVPF